MFTLGFRREYFCDIQISRIECVVYGVCLLINMYYLDVNIPRQGGGQVCFCPPPLWPRTFVKLTEDFFEKKAAAGEKFLGSLFSKIWRFLGKKLKN